MCEKRKCAVCDNFTTTPKQETCSRECAGKLKTALSREKRACVQCGTEFETRKKTERTMCSDECRKVFGKAHQEERIKKSLQLQIEKYGMPYIATEECKNKSKKTKLERYGDEKYVNVEKSKKTKFEKYGDENYRDKEKTKRTKKEKYGDENYNNRDKAKVTTKERFGVEYAIQNPDVLQKRVETNLEKYGFESPLQHDDIKEKLRTTNLERYGVENYSQTAEFKTKHKEKAEARNPKPICQSCGKKCDNLNMKVCSRICAYALKRKNSHEARTCPVCEKTFEERIKHDRFLCSDECRVKWGQMPENRENKYLKTQEAIENKYGVKNVFELQEFQDKAIQTKIEKYGDANYNNPEKNTQTKLDRYGPNYFFEHYKRMEKAFFEKHGVTHPLKMDEFKDKQKKTVQEKYGVDYVSQSPEIKKKTEETMMDRYGVKNPSQSSLFEEKKRATNMEHFGETHHMKNRDIFDKRMKDMYRTDEYNGVSYQGSYELLFLKFMDEKGLLSEVTCGKTYHYDWKGKSHTYHADFFFRGSNVEIKSAWTYDGEGSNIALREQNETKYAAVRATGDSIIVLKGKQEIENYVANLSAL